MRSTEATGCVGGKLTRLFGLISLFATLQLSLTGCSSAPLDSDHSEHVGKSSAELAVPVTLTISTPHAVAPLSPVVTAANSAFIGAGALVKTGQVIALGASGGGLHAEPDAILNESWSRGLAELRDRVLVRGTLHAATHLYGNNVPPPVLDASPAFDPLNTLSWIVTYPSSTTGAPITVDAQHTQPPLTPGQYGDVLVNSQGSLTFKSGTYYLRTLSLQSAGSVKLDQADGPVIIYVETGDLALRAQISTVTGDAPDLLIAYLGTTGFSIENLFNGAIIAPFATMTLRAVNGTHTGFFYSKDFQILDAHANVQYRAPLAIVKAAAPTGATCASVVTALVPAADLQAALGRYCGTCPSIADTDRDGLQDCLDGCPYDKLKTAPGVCGCGSKDTDTDGDGFPTCIETGCTSDPINIAPGQCGCFGEPNLQPAGTPCSDPAGPQANTTCNGAGVCGTPATSKPANGCRVVNWRGSAYWLCLPTGSVGGETAAPLTQTAAQQACSAKGLWLVRVDSLEEDRFLQQFIKAPAWIGANSITTSGNWRWSVANSNNGDQFWSGAANGTRVGARFNYWSSGAPASQRCAALMETDGRWSDVNCAQALGYVCEYRAQPKRTTWIVPPGMPHQPPSGGGGGGGGGACISEATAGLLPPSDANQATFQSQIIATQNGTPTGPFLNPPTSDTCSDDVKADGLTFTGKPGEGCKFVGVPNSACFVDQDCAKFGSGLICREVKDVASCAPNNSGQVPSGSCKGHAVCGTIQCDPDDDLPCDQKVLCNPDGPEVTAVLDNPTALDPQELTSAALFGNTLPNVAPTPAYNDPAHGPNNDLFGKNNAWCSNSPRQAAPASKSLPPTDGKSGTNSKIQFGFKPELIFDANPQILAQGETKFHVHAKTGLTASVNVTNFLGQSFTQNIFEASLGMAIDRCQINDTEDTVVKVFGQKLLDPSALGLPVIDSRDSSLNPDLYAFGRDCDTATDKYQLYADRAKKAFRDAHELVTQFRSAAQSFKLLSSNLCNAVHVVGSVDPAFPGGDDCPDEETADITIGRFLDYYQAPGNSQIQKLRDAQQSLAAATSKLKDVIAPLHLGFDGISREESQTVLNVPFFIGPIPMVLQVDVFARYGVGGGFDLKFSLPTGLLAGDNKLQNVVKLRASVVPYAGAGMSAFVGAGVDLGAFSATVGIEGAITLANVSAPIFAGIGLDVQALKDLRPIPQNILDVAAGPGAFHFGIPTALKFYVNYEYGAGVDLNDVLAGEINGRLKIKFAFFSRTWRKRIVKFNGWSKHFDLIKGGGDLAVFTAGETVPAHLPTADNSPDTVGTSTNVASGATPAGLAEAQAPLMVLVLPPGPPPGTTAVADWDASRLENVAYDGLCCSKAGETCQPGYAGRPQCCAGTECIAPPATGGVTPTGTCVAKCKNETESCTSTAQCCTGGSKTLVCGSAKICLECGALDAGCLTDQDCCFSYVCGADNTCRRKVQ